jgi:hypothetical protein
MESKPEKSPRDEEWEKRRLCPDGNCIGVIGPDGRCRECDLPCDETGTSPVSPALDEYAGDDGDEFSDEEAADEEAAPESGIRDSDWENRILCADGNCIGTIGPDGRCRECGKSLEG